MPQNKKQHFLPACYLYGFTNSEQRSAGYSKRDTLIWSYDLRRDLISERPIRKAAVRSYLYSYEDSDSSEWNHTVELFLARLESESTPVFTKAEDIGSRIVKGLSHDEFSVSERETLVEFIFYMMKRSPSLLTTMDEKTRAYFHETGQDGRDPSFLTLKTMMRIGTGSERNIPRELWQKNMTFIFTDPCKASWITTDQPFVRFNKVGRDGISMAGTEMYFPVFNGCLLFLHGDGEMVSYRTEKDAAFVRRTNRYIRGKANDTVIASSEAQLRSVSHE